MTIEEKLEVIRKYLSDRFPNHTVKVATLDDRFRYRFRIELNEDLAQSRQLTIPQEAVDDLFPADIIALLEHPDTEKLWKKIRGFTLHLVYDPVDGISLPAPRWWAKIFHLTELSF